MPFTVEYTHNKKRGLLSISHSTQQGAERGAKATVAAMLGTEKQLHLETIKKHDDEVTLAAFVDGWRKDKKLPPISDAILAQNAEQRFGKPADDEADDDE